GRCIYALTGDYNTAYNSAFAALYPDPFSALNMTVNDTILRYGDGSFDTVDAAFYLAVVGYAPTVPNVFVGSGSFNNCEFVGAGNCLEIDGGTYSFNNCHFHDFTKGGEVGGGTWNFNSCLFERGRGSEYLDIDWTGEGGPVQSTVNLNASVFCGSTNGRMIHASECDLTAVATIFNVTETVSNTKPVIRFSPGDYDSDWTLFLGGNYPAEGSSVTLDQCDVYNPFGVGILGDDPQDIPGEPVGDLLVTNSIFVCETPINLIGATGVAARNATVTNNDLVATGAVANPDGGWVLSESANLNEDPDYLAPGFCPTPDTAADSYRNNNDNLTTAGATGGPLGSQGVLEPPNTSDNKNWKLY
ncbi:MAG: hypothetical protein KC917_09195, partial [Candidatus Omnitrophica bacterium]|nr:hypothetical protein [Candidatus Omnitrophota bacterium]